jgi:Domain of unknown function (DUF4281)
MTADEIFSIANTLALLGWLVLILAPRWRWKRRIAGIVIPLTFAVLYIVVLTLHWGEVEGGGFGSLIGVEKLFSNRWVLLGGWVHYLAFDLFTGSWEVRDSQQRGMPHWMVIPCLVLTFLFGPAGLLLHFALRILWSKARSREAAGI